MFKLGTKEQPVKFAFVNVFEPRAMDETSEPKFEVMVLIDKEHTGNVTTFKKALADAKEKGKVEKWGGKIPNLKYETLKDGDEEAGQNLGLEGFFYFTARSKNKPSVISKYKQPITADEGGEEFYSGCVGIILIDLFPYKHKTGGAGVSVGLGPILKLADGPRMGGAPSAEAAFADEFEDGADDFDV